MLLFVSLVLYPHFSYAIILPLGIACGSHVLFIRLKTLVHAMDSTSQVLDLCDAVNYATSIVAYINKVYFLVTYLSFYEIICGILMML